MATATTEVRFTSSVKIDEDAKSKVIEILNARLADTVDLKTQVKHAHWNVKDPSSSSCTDCSIPLPHIWKIIPI